MFLKNIVALVALLSISISTTITTTNITEVISNSSKNEIIVSSNTIEEKDKYVEADKSLVEAIEIVEKKIVPSLKEYIEMTGNYSVTFEILKTDGYITEEIYNKVNGKVTIVASSDSLSLSGFENLIDVDLDDETKKSLWCKSSKHLPNTNITCNSLVNEITIAPQTKLTDLGLETGDIGSSDSDSGSAGDTGTVTEPSSSSATITAPIPMDSTASIEKTIKALDKNAAIDTPLDKEPATSTEKSIFTSSPGVLSSSKVCPSDYSTYSPINTLGDCRKDKNAGDNSAVESATRDTWTCTQLYKTVTNCTTSTVSYSCTNAFGCADTCYKEETTCVDSEVTDGFSSNPAGFESLCPSTEGEWKCEATDVNGRKVVGSSLSESTCTYDLEIEYDYTDKICESGKYEQSGQCLYCSSGYSVYTYTPSFMCQSNSCNTNWLEASNGSCYQCQNEQYSTLLLEAHECEANDCSVSGLESYGGDCYENCSTGYLFDSGECIKQSCDNTIDWTLDLGNEQCQKKACEINFFENEDATCCEVGTVFEASTNSCLTMCPNNYSENADNTCCPSNSATETTEYLIVNGSMQCVSCPIGTTFNGIECQE